MVAKYIYTKSCSFSQLIDSSLHTARSCQHSMHKPSSPGTTHILLVNVFIMYIGTKFDIQTRYPHRFSLNQTRPKLMHSVKLENKETSTSKWRLHCKCRVLFIELHIPPTPVKPTFFEPEIFVSWHSENGYRVETTGFETPQPLTVQWPPIALRILHHMDSPNFPGTQSATSEIPHGVVHGVAILKRRGNDVLCVSDFLWIQAKWFLPLRHLSNVGLTY